MIRQLKRPAWNKTSPHKYGIFSMGETVFVDGLLQKVAQEFGSVRFLEIGVANGATMAGVVERCDAIGTKVYYEGVDFAGGKPEELPPECKFIEGDSTQVFPKVSDGFHILFIDGSHAQNYVMLDFLNYSPKVVVNGYVLFHDTRDGTWQGSHYQGTGPEDMFENRISVRLGLKKLGLMDGRRRDFVFVQEIADVDVMGMMLFRKLEAL